MVMAAGQKNLGASGASLIVARKDFIASATQKLPTILRFEDHANAGSRLNTPPTFAVRVMGLMAEWTLAVGGPDAIAKHNARKANLIWDAVDRSGGFYSWPAEKWSPAPARMMAPTLSSFTARRKALSSWKVMSAFCALRTPGRFMQMMATPPRCS
jgi:phosphoserine aminotransferase